MATTIISIIFTAIIGGIGWLLKSETERRREIEKQLSDKKYAVYLSIIELFFDIVSSAKQKKEIPNEKLVSRMMKITEGLIIYGSDNVLKKFSSWKASPKEGNGIHALITFTEIILEIRRDMGQPNSKVDMDDVLGMFIIDYSDFKKEIDAYKNTTSVVKV